MPILSFAIVFGLSMDYEVFLVSRVLEEWRSGLSERSAVIEGLARTAGLITSAAAIMIAVVAAFTVGKFLVIQMLGFTLAVAVFIDATAVRMVVGPALLQLAGDWNWWPFGLCGAAATSEKELIHDGEHRGCLSDSGVLRDTLINRFDLFHILCLSAGLADNKCVRPRLAFAEPLRFQESRSQACLAALPQLASQTERRSPAAAHSK